MRSIVIGGFMTLAFGLNLIECVGNPKEADTFKFVFYTIFTLLGIAFLIKGGADVRTWLAEQTWPYLDPEVDQSHPPAIKIKVRTKKIARIDVYLDSRLLTSVDVQNGVATICLPDGATLSGTLELRGFAGGSFVAVCKMGIPWGSGPS